MLEGNTNALAYCSKISDMDSQIREIQFFYFFYQNLSPFFLDQTNRWQM